MVKDIWPGVANGEPYAMMPFGDQLLFTADVDSLGEELWVTDGTLENTVLVKDIDSGPNGSEPVVGAVHHGVAFLMADDGIHGRELWRTDGTRDGTRLVADIARAPEPIAYSEPVRFTPLGNRCYFLARDISRRYQLWVSDGASENPARVSATPSAIDASSFGGMIGSGDVMYFTVRADDGVWSLWETQGDATTTRVVMALGALQSDAELLLHGRTLYFNRANGDSGEEVWQLDIGDKNNTRMVEVRPGPMGSSPRSLFVFDEAIYFVADDGIHGEELWCISQPGNAATLVSDLYLGIEGSAPGNLMASGDRLYFSARNDKQGVCLWALRHGAPAPIPLIGEEHAWPNVTRPLPASLCAKGYQAVFSFDDGIHGSELWISGGSLESTHLLRDCFPARPSGAPAEIVAAGSKVYFRAEHASQGVELWVTEGTEESTGLVLDLFNGPGSASPSWLTPFESVLFLSAGYSRNGRNTESAPELIAINLETNARILFSDIRQGTDGSYPSELRVACGLLYFSADDGISGREPWVLDPKTMEPRMLKDILPD